MLSSVKDARGGTLLDYLVHMLERDEHGLLPLDDMPTLPRSGELSLEAISDEVQALLESVTNVTQQISVIGADESLAVFKAEMEIFAEEATKVREEIVSLRALMMNKNQAMMGHFGERNKVSRARQEDVLRMLREFLVDLDAASARLSEKRERAMKTAAKAAQASGADPHEAAQSAAAAVGGFGSRHSGVTTPRAPSRLHLLNVPVADDGGDDGGGGGGGGGGPPAPPPPMGGGGGGGLPPPPPPPRGSGNGDGASAAVRKWCHRRPLRAETAKAHRG
eukprot:TRINITY_DN6080_c0_g1_i3.p2 TRINITY_DN6080_c0_g1~~TRINITY_DN6080_c0_g1_i3.p2  ORF type:complete len:278 (+),score=129.75 TRINITY_DN6080_c0_g1_i3:813-1646(+)